MYIYKYWGRTLSFICLIFCINQWLFAQTGDATSEVLSKQVANIFASRCTSCHGGKNPTMGLNLEKSIFIIQTVGVKSKQHKNMVLIEPGNPEASYLVYKITGNKKIQGESMPLRASSLKSAEINLIEKWIKETLNQYQIDPSTQKPVSKGQTALLAGTQLINLPTPTLVPAGHLLFKISHRYFPTVEAGYDSFYGLDGPANIQFAFGYGFFKKFHLMVSRANQFQEWQLRLRWLAFKGEIKFPISLALDVGGSWVSQQPPDTIGHEVEKVKFSSQVILAFKLISPVTLLLVPSYATNVNHLQADSENIFVFGTAVQIKIFRQLSLMAEWLPRLAGYKNGSSGWGVGAEYVIGKHIFHLFITNSTGLTINQYLIGGTPYGDKGEMRIGFNIFREF